MCAKSREGSARCGWWLSGRLDDRLDSFFVFDKGPPPRPRRLDPRSIDGLGGRRITQSNHSQEFMKHKNKRWRSKEDIQI